MSDAAMLATEIGRRVRGHRQARGWTLEQLAEVAQVSRRMLVNVEQGTSNASITLLLKVSDALGVGLPALVEPPRPAVLVDVTTAGQGPVLWRGHAGGQAVLVAAAGGRQAVELWDWSVAPGERYDGEAHTAGTRELLHVLEGALDLEVGEETTHLRTGDAAGFPGDVPHAYVNAGTVAARFSLAVFEPGAGHHLKESAARA